VAAGGITSEEEEEQLEALNDWMEEQGLPPGVLAYDFADAATGEQKSVFDLAWPNGIQEELSQPVAVLLNEDTETIAIASQAGYRYFHSDRRVSAVCAGGDSGRGDLELAVVESHGSRQAGLKKQIAPAPVHLPDAAWHIPACRGRKRPCPASRKKPARLAGHNAIRRCRAALGSRH
jgi:hypothetical protein